MSKFLSVFVELSIFIFMVTASFPLMATGEQPTPSNLPKLVKVISDSSDIREKADNSSPALMNVKAGAILEVKEKSGEWLRVTLPNTVNTVNPQYGYILQSNTEEIKPKEKKQKDHFFLMGMGMMRINWASVKGDEIRFRYSDLGLPTDFSTRERASFMADGTFGDGKYSINGHVNYDPENRITEPPLEFLVNIGNKNTYMSVGDYQMGVMMDSIFSRYYHPFRGAILGARSDRLGAEIMGGLARGESGLEEIPATAGSGPYYIKDSPILRGSEMIYLVTKSLSNPDTEIKRTPMVRNQDYFVDYDRGAVIFNYSLYASDELGNPVYIFINYQFESLAGRFSRFVYGVKAFAIPVKILKLNFSYIADSDKDQSLGDIFKNSRGIYTFGVNVDSKPLTLFSELSFNAEKNVDNQKALFAGGIWTITKKLRLFFNAWDVDTDFPTFANSQLQYGYSLNQVFPSYAERNIYLSPFQFVRNLGAELYPFSMSRLSVDETEMHGFLEYESKTLRLSTGYGTRKETLSKTRNNIIYTSGFFNKEATKAWGKVGMDTSADPDKIKSDTKNYDLLAGIRQRIKKFSNGGLFVQADYKSDWFNDFLDLSYDSYYRTFSVSGEYLTGTEGLFAGYRKEILNNRNTDKEVLNADIFEVGIRRHVYKGFFVDSRYRNEKGVRDNVHSSNKILSLGAGIETKKIRAMGRYEVQLNESNGNEGKRRLWSFYFFGSPYKRMSVNLRYYKQLGENKAPLSLNERSEEELSIRFLWRPWDFLNLYSQWRYDTNLEIYPPLDRTKSDSLASVQGLKWTISKRMEFLANYKLLKVWGPIENRKYSAAAELGYLVFRHFRIGVGVEQINFRDALNKDANYKSTVGYLKLVALY